MHLKKKPGKRTFAAAKTDTNDAGVQRINSNGSRQRFTAASIGTSVEKQTVSAVHE